MAVRDLIPRFRSRAPISRSESFSPFVAFQEEMNRLFDDFWRGFDGMGSTLMPSFSFPRVEVSETDREVRVEAELPGMDEKDVELLLEDGVLTIRGERGGETEDRDRRLSERYYGRFERRIALPAEVQEDNISASFKRGLLTVTLPKSPQSMQKAKRIRIESE